jgi:hypothetical protein
MDELTDRLEALFRRYAAELEQCHDSGIQLERRFQEEADRLIAQYGQPAIAAVLDDVDASDESWPSVSLH